MLLYESTVHRMLSINYNKNINKMFDFWYGIRFEFGNVQYCYLSYHCTAVYFLTFALI